MMDASDDRLSSIGVNLLQRRGELYGGRRNIHRSDEERSSRARHCSQNPAPPPASQATRSKTASESLHWPNRRPRSRQPRYRPAALPVRHHSACANAMDTGASSSGRGDSCGPAQITLRLPAASNHRNEGRRDQSQESASQHNRAPIRFGWLDRQ